MEFNRQNPVEKSNQKIKHTTPARVIVLSFLLVILIGSVLLTLPISSADGTVTPYLNSLFTATSATCVTGLITYDTYTHWSVFGQIIILILIQIGGIGLVTLTTFFTSFLKNKLGFSSILLIQESVNANSRSHLIFLLRLVVTSTLIIEFIGAFFLAFRFVPELGAEGIWISIFTAVSAYCNAGFDIFGRFGQFSSITTFVGDPLVNLVIMSLIVIGGLGFIVFADVLNYRKSRQLMLHTRIVLTTTPILIFLGAAIVFFNEYHNPATLGNLSLSEKFFASLFQSITCRTAGFNSINISQLNDSTKLVMCALMFIGAAPGSTGGGIKITTFAVLVMTVVAVIRNQYETTIFHRRVDHKVVYKSFAIAILSICIIIITTSVLVIENSQITTIDGIFETFSAFCTVGITTGITSFLGNFSKIALILTMFIGRVGPFSFFIAMALKQSYNNKRMVLPEGQIMVG